MFRPTWSYPGGVVASALLMLRLQTAAIAVAQAYSVFEYSRCATVSFSLLAAALAFGLFTRTCAALVTLMALWLTFLVECDLVLPHITSALSSAALALLGAGAWSIDARVFGRKLIVLRQSRRLSSTPMTKPLGERDVTGQGD